MLRHNLTPIDPPPEEAPRDRTSVSPFSPAAEESVERLDIQQSLDVLEEIILESPRIPLSRRTLVDEDRLLEQLDRIRLNLPTAFQEALRVVQQQEAILAEAEQYAQSILQAADQEAARRLDDMAIMQQAEAEAQQVKQQLQQDCDAMKSQTRSEIEHWQTAAQKHWEQAKQQTESECQAFRQDADAYATQVLGRVEQQLSEMLSVIYNGRQALQLNGAMGKGQGSTAPKDGVPDSAAAPPKSHPPHPDRGHPGRSRRTAG